MRENVPLFSQEERDRRWMSAREQMALLGLDCLVVWSREAKGSCGFANFRYLTQIPTAGVLIFPLKGGPITYIDEAQVT